MINKLIRIAIVLLLLGGVSTPILAGDTGTILVTGVPAYTPGIISFTITYISDAQLDLDWTVAAGIGNVMIRANYGHYPDDIPDAATAPSDGYLVYYGAGLAVSDTSMDFNQNAGPLFYKAWGQRLDGTWEMVASTGFKESKNMILIAFLLPALSLTVAMFLSKGARSPLLGFPCGICWFLAAGLIYSTMRVDFTDIFGITSFAFFFIGIFCIYASFAFNNKDLDFTRKQSLDAGMFLDEGKRRAKAAEGKAAAAAKQDKDDGYGPDGDDSDWSWEDKPSSRAAALHRRAADRRSSSRI